MTCYPNNYVQHYLHVFIFNLSIHYVKIVVLNVRRPISNVRFYVPLLVAHLWTLCDMMRDLDIYLIYSNITYFRNKPVKSIKYMYNYYYNNNFINDFKDNTIHNDTITPGTFTVQKCRAIFHQCDRQLSANYR